jgi:hypothetical protein
MQGNTLHQLALDATGGFALHLPTSDGARSRPSAGAVQRGYFGDCDRSETQRTRPGTARSAARPVSRTVERRDSA